MAKSTPATPVTPVQTLPAPQPSIAVQALEEKLRLAKAAATPVIIEKVSEDRDQIVYMDHTHGTLRKDLLGGSEPLKDEGRLTPVEVSLWDTPFEGGKVVSQDVKARTIELESGTVRQDHK